MTSHRRAGDLQPSAEPLPTTPSALHDTILSIGSGTFTQNIAGVPIIACTKSVEDPPTLLEGFPRESTTRTRDALIATRSASSALGRRPRRSLGPVILLFVERALAEMGGQHASAPTLPILGSVPSLTQHELLQKFFMNLLNPHAERTGTTASVTATGKLAATGPRASSGVKFSSYLASLQLERALFVSALLQYPLADDEKDVPRIDFVAGCDRADGCDEGEKDTLARLFAYTVPSSAPSYRPRTSFLAAAICCLDHGSGRELEVIRKEQREQSTTHVRYYTEPSAETLFATPNTLQSTTPPLGPGTFTHNITDVPTIDDHTNLVSAGVSGMGGMVKGKGGEWEERRRDPADTVLRTIRLKCACHIFILFSSSWHDRRRKPPSHDTATDDTQRLTPIRAPCPILPPAPSPDGALDSTAASLGKIIVLRDGFDAKAWGEVWERDLSSDAGGPRPKPTPLPPVNHPTPEQAFLAKNYDENPRRADRDPHGIFRTPTDASAAPAAGLVGPLCSSSFSFPTVERALVETGEAVAPRFGVLGRGASAPTSPIPGSMPNPTQHEVLENFFKRLLNPKDCAASPYLRR
ncbi:hypothetical protein V8E53_001586 [Lactarius tabidus]